MAGPRRHPGDERNRRLSGVAIVGGSGVAPFPGGRLERLAPSERLPGRRG